VTSVPIGIRRRWPSAIDAGDGGQPQLRRRSPWMHHGCGARHGGVSRTGRVGGGCGRSCGSLHTARCSEFQVRRGGARVAGRSGAGVDGLALSYRRLAARVRKDEVLAGGATRPGGVRLSVSTRTSDVSTSLVTFNVRSPRVPGPCAGGPALSTGLKGPPSIRPPTSVQL
jgi:hypothetical protein